MSKTYHQQDFCDRCHTKAGVVVMKDRLVCLKCKRELRQETKKGRKNGRNNIHTRQETTK